MPVIPSGFSQVNMRFTGSNLPTGAEITFGIDNNTDSPSDMAADIASVWNTAEMDELQVNDLALTSILVKSGPSETGPSGEWVGSIPGTSTSESVGPNTAFLFRKITADGGRSGRGRFFVPGLPENVIDAKGDVDSGFVDSAIADGEDFRAGLVSAGLPMVVLHSAGAPISTPSPVTQLLPQVTTATQRRRLRR